MSTTTFSPQQSEFERIYALFDADGSDHSFEEFVPFRLARSPG
ncbi:hypothetical protein S7335_441 [Synechococcus sp. PCC 7335]|nr:hypothetical protein [Synechococcus sp. PCC 7335]EDX83261.1 hypothetical protein S7335_441 [Synechococcus sp. PCC 7335]